MRLNLGCGGQIIEGWTNVDRAFAWHPGGITVTEPVVVHDLAEPLPIKDEEATMAVAHHVLDLLDADDLKALVAEVYRVLGPGGVLRVSSVDYRNALAALVQHDFSYFNNLGVPFVSETIAETFAWYLDWGGARRTVFFAPAQLGLDYLEPAGFTWVVVGFHETTMRSGAICELDSREDESWFLEATKPE